MSNILGRHKIIKINQSQHEYTQTIRTTVRDSKRFTTYKYQTGKNHFPPSANGNLRAVRPFRIKN